MDNNPKNYRLQDIYACTRCGFCCQGATTVSLDSNDQERMVTALELSRAEVARRFWRITGNVVQMQIRDGHCIFYHPDQGCTVHEGRPWRCRQWPLHPSMLEDENNYTTITDSCPGFNKSLNYNEFCKIFRALLANGEIGKFKG